MKTSKELIEEASKELDSYTNLPKGWDGYYGDGFRKELVTLIQFILSYIFLVCKEENIELTDVVPCPINDGSIDIEIEMNDRSITYCFSNFDSLKRTSDGILVDVYKEYPNYKYEYPVYLNRKIIKQDLLELAGR